MKRLALPFFYGWLLLVNIGSMSAWAFGPAMFVFLLLNGYAVHRFLLQGNRSRGHGERGLNRLLVATAALAVGLFLFGVSYSPDWLLDIGANTDAAIRALLAGRNPYATRAQLWNESFRTEDGISLVDGEFRMFGIPYYFGYPYFPAMALGYLPMTALLGNYTAIRLSNLVLSLTNLWIFLQILQRCFPDRSGYERARKTGFVALFFAPSYLVGMYYLGMTDIIVTSFLLLALFFLDSNRLFTAGICLGLAQASKLMPAPIVLLAVLFWLPDNRDRLATALGFLLSSSLLLVPFVLWNPEGFFSATILYYLTHHAGGDDTSLWYYLPPLGQHLLFVLSPLLTIAYTAIFSRRYRGDLFRLAAVCFNGYLVFIAFSKMSHFNYYWTVYPLVCLALIRYVEAPYGDGRG